MNLLTHLLSIVQYDHATETYSGYTDLDTCLRRSSTEYAALDFAERMKTMLEVNVVIKTTYFNRPMEFVNTIEPYSTNAKNIEYFYVAIDTTTMIAHITDDFDEHVTDINIKDLLTVTRNGTPLDELIKTVLVQRKIASADDVVTMLEQSKDEPGST